MRYLVALSLLLTFMLPARALTCAPSERTPKQQISDAYDKSDLVALVTHSSSRRHGELIVKAVWKGHPQQQKIRVKFTWADLPARGEFVVFASATSTGYVDEVVCLFLWGQRKKLLREIYGEPVVPTFPARPSRS